jgi:hypothetical protein
MRILALALAILIGFTDGVRAFCGFYVARADASLFNRSSKVVLAHSSERTVITMASDVQGDPKEFAIVIPVPTVIEKEQIRVVEPAAIDHLDAYTAPRLVEYFDEDPCAPRPVPMPSSSWLRRSDTVAAGAPRERAEALGVKIEATYAVGEYDIVILSALDSGGLLTWLNENGYKVPPAANAVVGSYLRQNMHFFLAKVNLERQGAMGFSFLRPIQVAYQSAKFMLPIRLGTINASGPQDMIVLALSPRGRVETTNYRTVRLPSGDEIPLYVKASFGDFYRAMFEHQVSAENGRAVFLEYAWDMSWCDPCAADPLSAEELNKLGAFWLAGSPSGAPGQTAFVTRLHVRYDRAHFPEDLMLQETSDRANFQGRYVLRHPFAGAARCEAGAEYRRQLVRNFAQQAQALARLTGWDIADIRQRMAETGQALQ